MPEPPHGSAAPARVRLQRCEDCGRRWQTPTAGCPYCGGTRLAEDLCDGVGTVYSWVSVCRSLQDPPAPVPYVVVTVDLEAGARVFGRYESGTEPEAGEPVVCIRSDETVVSALRFVCAGDVSAGTVLRAR